MTERFLADWLALRERFDAQSRSLVLARRLISALPQRPRLLDLGAGTGSLFRFMAPLIARSQRWYFVDADAELLSESLCITTAWARARGWAVASSERGLQIRVPEGVWSIEIRLLDLADAPRGLPLAEVDAVLCSALLDLVSGAWFERLADALNGPFLAGLCVDGRDAWSPPHPSDAIVCAGFRRDQERDKGFGPALGVTAPSVAAHALAARGFVIKSARSDWLVPHSEVEMACALARGVEAGARAALPQHRVAITKWATARLRQAMAGEFTVRLSHRDLLALRG